MEISILAILAGSTCFIIALLWAGLMDILTMRIQNELVLFLIAIYAALAPLTGVGLTTVAWNVAISLTLLAAMFVLFSLGWIGGGDAKFASVVMLWIGSEQAFDFLLYTALFGGFLTLIVLQFRRTQVPAPWLNREWLARLHQPQCGVPYGAAIAAGALAVLPKTSWFAALP